MDILFEHPILVAILAILCVPLAFIIYIAVRVWLYVMEENAISSMSPGKRSGHDKSKEKQVKCSRSFGSEPVPQPTIRKGECSCKADGFAMSTQEELKARFPGIPRECFSSELEGCSPAEVRALEHHLDVVFPESFRAWLLLFGERIPECTFCNDCFNIMKIENEYQDAVGFKSFAISGGMDGYDLIYIIIEGSGGYDSPVYSLDANLLDEKPPRIYIISPSFVDYIQSKVVKSYRKLDADSAT